jgi:hypothetical protein
LKKGTEVFQECFAKKHSIIMLANTRTKICSRTEMHTIAQFYVQKREREKIELYAAGTS